MLLLCLWGDAFGYETLLSKIVNMVDGSLGVREGSLGGALEMFICTTFNAWHGGGTHQLVGHFYLLLKIKSLPSPTLN
jgi:hypothetical protein